MSDKIYKGKTYPLHCYESSNLFKRIEPIMTPSKLISRFLLGVPLPPEFRDEEVLKDRIDVAINEAELLLKTTINSEKFVEKVPYDSSLYRSFIHIRTEHKPILAVEGLFVTSADGQVVYEVPIEWIEVANNTSGQINVIPLLTTFGALQSGGNVSQNAGMIFIATLGQMHWLPAFWEIKYKSGMCPKEGQVPVVVNNIVGAIAAIDLLSNLASLNTSNSVSLSQDGISQSTSGQGPQVYMQRIQDIESKKQKMLEELKALYGNKYIFGNI